VSGKVGFCAICNSPNVAKINRKVREGWNASQLNEYVKGLGEPGWIRQTWYTHKPHAQTAEARVTEAKSLQVTPERAVAIRQASNTDFLEAVRDIGYTKAIENPDSVTLEQALKAVSILEGRKSSAADSVKVLVGIFTGSAPSYIIEGEAREVEGDR